MIRFACPKCRSSLRAPVEKAGAVAACPKCRTRVRVPQNKPPQPFDFDSSEGALGGCDVSASADLLPVSEPILNVQPASQEPGSFGITSHPPLLVSANPQQWARPSPLLIVAAVVFVLGAVGAGVLFVVVGTVCFVQPALSPSTAELIADRLRETANDPSSISVASVREYPTTWDGRQATAAVALCRGKNGFGALVARRMIFIIQDGRVVSSGNYDESFPLEINLRLVGAG